MKNNIRAAKGCSGFGAVSIFALLAAIPQMAIAQDNTIEAKGETVVITGLRGSLTKSIKIKKENASIVEVISAEEIGKLPDSSIAESLARLPGIAGQRVNGDVQVINLRGTSPDFTVTTFNGRLQGSLGDGRGVEIDQYPSELINGVVVYKTPDASVAGQGLSGTVDLRSIRPLSQAGKSIVINVRADTSDMDELNPEAKKWGGRATLSYVNQFMDNKLGVAFGLAYSDTTRQTQHQKLWNWRPASTGNSGILPGKTTAEQASLMPTGFEIRALSNHKVRTGFMGVIEYQPNDNSHTTADLYYSKYKQDEYLRGIEMLSEWGVDGFSVPSGTISEVGGSKFLSQYVLAGGYPILNNQVHARDDSVLSGGINHKFKSRNWDMEVDASYSKAEGDATNVQIIAGYGANRTGDTLNIGIGLDDFSSIDPGLNYADASKIYLGDNAPWGGWGQEGFRQLPHIEDTYAGLDFKAKTSLEDTFLSSLFGSFELGVNFSSHEKIKSSTDEDLCLKSAVASTGIGQDGGNQCV
ncbi:MAG: TonB-dependent receptor plug domain-containing protein, partial [Caulobacterales bacterium]|nr:TonB-dependent receptor plug domain-containing protein [Caulobacterales bacterium]